MTTTLNRTLNDSSEDKINTEERIKIRDIEIVDVIVMSGSAVSALALSYFFFQILLPVSGVLGFWCVGMYFSTLFPQWQFGNYVAQSKPKIIWREPSSGLVVWPQLCR